jgi:hypothetical protein
MRNEMRFIAACRFFLLLSVTSMHQAAFATEAVENAEEIRATIARSMPFIEKNGAEWIANKGCLSCHHTAFAVWSLSAAKQKGVRVDEAKLDEWRGLIADWPNLLDPSVRAQAKREVTVPANPDTVAQVLLASGPWHSEESASQPWVTEYVNGLLAGQQTDGSWLSGGQLPLQKRPKRETQEVTTMWALLALASVQVPDDALPDIVKKARSWLGEETVGSSTEWWATRLMLERKFGDAENADRLRAELLKRQRTDGGWGWLCEVEGDALGTGIALFALGDDKIPATHPAIANAHQFLAHTQSDDGSWPVHGTKQNKKDRIEPTATFWGTCWAVIGLCATIDD